MAQLVWDKVGERVYETGVDHGVLYIPDNAGNYVSGFAWNGLTGVTESPGGAEASPQYADNIKYLNLVSLETFGGTIEAFTYPLEFEQCDGSASPTPGISVGQQGRRTFGLSYRTIVGNDVDGSDHGYKLHLIYGALAAPSEKAYATVNDSPEALAFSWEISTTPVDAGTELKPTASLTINSTKVNAAALASLEAVLYGTSGQEPRLPPPVDVIAMFATTVVQATPTAPTYNSGTHTITIPTVAGVTYRINGVAKTGSVVISADTIVTATPNTGYSFPPDVDDDWGFDFV